MDLVALATRLKSGESSLGTIDAEINSYRKLYALPPPENDEEFAEWLQRRESLAGAIDQLASTLRSEDTEQGIVSLGRVLTSAASLLETGTRLQAWASVGERLARIKAYESALDWFDAADGIYDELTNTDKKYPLQNVLFKPECLEALNRYQDLEQFAQRLIETLGEAAPFYKHLGAAKSALGRHPEAIKAFNRALELFDQVEPGKNVDGERADVYYRLGASARSAGDYEGALQAFESARSFALQAKNRVLAAFALSEQGITWNQVGDELRGRKLLVAAAAEADALGRAIDAARWRAAPPPPDTPTENVRPVMLLVWAGAFLRQVPPNTAEARRLSLAAIAGSVEERDLRNEAEARITLAQSYALEGKHAQALPPARRAVQLAKTLGDKTLEMTYRTNLAILARAEARISEAEQELRAAIDLGRALRKSAHTTEFRQTINGWLANAYDLFSSVLAQEWKGKDGHNLPRRNEALIELGQEARANNFARWIAAEAAISKSEQDDLRPALLTLRAAEVRLEMFVMAQRGELTPVLNAERVAREEFAQTMKQRGLDFEFVAPIFSPQELGDSLSTDHYMLDLYAGQEQVFATLIKAGGTLETISIPWPRANRVEFMRGWQSRVFGNSRAEWRQSRFNDLGVQRASATNAETASLPSVSDFISELKEQFIGPLAGLVAGCRRLTVIPHRELSLVPYGLIDERASGMRISLAPGANIFRLLSSRRRDTSGSRVALGDATGNLKYVPMELDSLPNYSQLPNKLDGTVQSLADAALVHFAGHGQFNEANPYLAGMVVEWEYPTTKTQSDHPFGSLGIYGEELLTVGEVLAQAQLPRCFLAVLSGCSTGLPRQHRASEFVGLPAAFLIAGANNVIGSLWPVQDGATCIMMQEFYRALFADDNRVTSVSGAMAEARKSIRSMQRSEVVRRLGSEDQVPPADPPYDSPKYMLAFQHYGVD